MATLHSAVTTRLGSLIVGVQAGGTGQLRLLVEVGVGRLVGEAQPAVGGGLQVGVGPGPVTPYYNHTQMIG